MNKFTELITVREFVDTLITCLLPIEIVKKSGPALNVVWKGFKDEIDECEYADSKIFNNDGTLCGIYLNTIVIWIDE